MAEPGYWQNETSGLLAPVIGRLVKGHMLDAGDVAIMRAYLRQWIAGPWMGPTIPQLRADVDRLFTHEDVVRWLERAALEGIDPL